MIKPLYYIALISVLLISCKAAKSVKDTGATTPLSTTEIITTHQSKKLTMKERRTIPMYGVQCMIGKISYIKLIQAFGTAHRNR